jgi:predicted ABC-type ATPase
MELGLAEKPRLLIVGGPNGSGKTTVALQYASIEAIPYINADAIAAALNPASPADASIEAGRHFIHALETALAYRNSCVVESTLSGRSLRKRVIEARDFGYDVTIVFVYLDSADACVARVAERVRKGGHHVPEADIRRRFGRSVTNFWSLYRELADAWVVLYNGGNRIQDVSVGSRHELTVRDATLHTAFMSLVELFDD